MWLYQGSQRTYQLKMHSCYGVGAPRTATPAFRCETSTRVGAMAKHSYQLYTEIGEFDVQKCSTKSVGYLSEKHLCCGLKVNERKGL